MSKSDFHTIRKLKLWVRVLVFSVLNVGELIRWLTRARNLKKQCMYMLRLLSPDSTFDLFNFFPKYFSKI